MNKTKIQSLLSALKDQPDAKPKGLRLNSKTLIIDGMNTFIGAFAADNKFNHFGHHVGGIASFLKSIGYVIKNEAPTRVMIVFDGEGGHISRRMIYPDYKRNRDNLATLVNKKVFEDKKEEDRAKLNELERLVEYLEFLPITLLSLDKLEADDVMAYLTHHLYAEHPDNHICIMSADRDFLQLINDRTYVYSPIKRKHYYTQDVIDEFKCRPDNYLVYKCFLGDTSDNVKGVHGVGERKIDTLFGGALSEGVVTFDDIYKICEEPPTNSVLYDRILNSKHILDVNSKIMDLSAPNLSAEQEDYVIQELIARPHDLRKFDFLQLWYLDKMNDAIPSIDQWINLFSVLNQ